MNEEIINRRENDKMIGLIIDNKLENHAKNCKVHNIEKSFIEMKSDLKAIKYIAISIALMIISVLIKFYIIK